MSAFFTYYGQNQLIDFFRNSTITLPGSWFIALGTGSGPSGFSEISDSEYARVEVARSLANWSGTQASGSTAVSSGASHKTSNNVAIDFGTSGSWGTPTGVGFYDAETDGNCWFWVALNHPRVIAADKHVQIKPTALQLTFGSTGASNHFSNKIIDMVMRGQTFVPPSTVKIKLMTVAPTNYGGGTEVAASGYTTPTMDLGASGYLEWSATQGPTVVAATSTGTSGKTDNLAELDYPGVLEDWGDVHWVAMTDGDTDDLWFWAPLTNGLKRIRSGADAPYFSATSLVLALYLGTQTQPHYTIDITKGQITFTGGVIGALEAHSDKVTPASIVFTGKALDVTHLALYQIALTPATITFTGASISPDAEKIIHMSPGTITFTGASMVVLKPEMEYYTSVLYPTLTTESMSVAVPSLQAGTLIKETIESLSVGVPTLQSGTLVVTINFLNYTNEQPDNLSVSVPTLQSGTLVGSISFVSYGPKTESMSVAVPTLQSGTLVVTIAYVNYTNAITENLSVAVPTLQSGTLT